MMEKEKTIILYHGSPKIVKYPEIRIQKYHKDFYFGFYCTKLAEQAIRWAIRYNGKGYLNMYEYHPNNALKIKYFPKMSEEWLDFIINCRLGMPHDYDIVEGPMANDSIFNYVQDVANGNISRESFWTLAKFKHPTHQISFHTARALQTLRFVEGREVFSDEIR